MSEKKDHSQIRILYENKYGYIAKCACCDEVQFCIGNVFSFLPEEAFYKLYRSFQRVNTGLEDKLLKMPNGNRVMLRTPVDDFLLSLSPEEFRQVMDLFDRGVANLRLSASLEKLEMMN